MSDLSANVDARRAGPDDAETVAQLLHDFNTEFDTSTPCTAVLTRRLQSLLAGPITIAYLAGEPAAGVALVTLRSNVWYDGPVASSTNCMWRRIDGVVASVGRWSTC